MGSFPFWGRGPIPYKVGIPFAERIENRELRVNQAASEDLERSLLGVVFGDSPCKPEGQLSTRKEAGAPGGEGGPQPAGKGQRPGSAWGREATAGQTRGQQRATWQARHRTVPSRKRFESPLGV